MKIYAIWSSKTDRFIAAFPDRKDAMNYGIVMFGPEDGWEYDIREMYMYETKQYSFSQPLIQPLTTTPYTPPIPLKSTPYTPNIWCEVKGPTATYEEDTL